MTGLMTGLGDWFREQVTSGTMVLALPVAVVVAVGALVVGSAGVASVVAVSDGTGPASSTAGWTTTSPGSRNGPAASRRSRPRSGATRWVTPYAPATGSRSSSLLP